jgi:hypothetical protein
MSMEFNYKKIDTKNNIDLYVNNDNNHNYFLTTKLSNSRYNLKQVININLFQLMYELNKDIIESIQIIKQESNKNNVNILLRFNDLAKDLGIKKKFMFSNINYVEREKDNICIFQGKDLTYTHNLENYDKINAPHSNLTIKFDNEHSALLTYNFEISINDKLPIYMETFPGLLIKKIMLRVKEFIENMD